MPRNTLLLLALVCCAYTCGAADRAVVYLHVADRRTALDNLAHEHFDKMYEVLDFDDRQHSYVYPKGVSGFERIQPVYVEGRCLAGNVVVLYVITADGFVTAPFAAESTNPVLSAQAVRAMTERRFQPAEIDRKRVSTIAASRFTFPCPA
jgi:hypothetical protein